MEGHMGIFDRFIKDVTRKAVGDAIDSVTGQNHSSAPTPQASQPSYTPAAAPEMPAEDNRPLEVKLDSVLSASFPSYQVQKKVDPRTMGATDTYLLPYDYVISQGGQVKLIIMMPGKNTCSTRAYRFSRQFAERNGITLINFLLDSLNEESYITNRLHQYL